MRSKGRTVNNYVAHRLRQIRVERGLTSSELAQRTGSALGSYSCLENGWYKINIDNLFKILQALQAKVTEVWPETEGGDGPINMEYIQQAVEQALVQIPRKLQLERRAGEEAGPVAPPLRRPHFRPQILPQVHHVAGDEPHVQGVQLQQGQPAASVGASQL